MPAERIITEQPFPMESFLLMCLVVLSITKVLTPLSLHHVYIIPVVIAIIYGLIQGETVALQSPCKFTAAEPGCGSSLFSGLFPGLGSKAAPSPFPQLHPGCVGVLKHL